MTIARGPYYYCWRCGGKGTETSKKTGEVFMCVVCAPVPPDAYTSRHKVNPFEEAVRHEKEGAVGSGHGTDIHGDGEGG